MIAEKKLTIAFAGDTMTTAKTWGGYRTGAGRKPAPPHLSGSTIIVNVRDLTQSQRETLIALVNEWLAQQAKEETK